MRKILAAACLVSVAAFAFSTPATAANGHWVCDSNGIPNWKSDVTTTDAAGWKYDGADRTAFKPRGKCTHT